MQKSDSMQPRTDPPRYVGVLRYFDFDWIHSSGPRASLDPLFHRALPNESERAHLAASAVAGLRWLLRKLFPASP